MPRARNNKPTAKDKPVLVFWGNESFDGKTHHIDVYVDWVAIVRTLGRRAVENKSGKASLMYGSIVVKART